MDLLIIIIGIIVIGFLVVTFFRGAGILNYLYDVGSKRSLNKIKGEDDEEVIQEYRVYRKKMWKLW
jgi:hypothetical protein